MSDSRPIEGEDNDSEANEPFARRWSRRKAQSRAGETPDDDAQAAPGTDDAREAAHDPAAAEAAPEITDADLPDPDELDGRSDLSAFLGGGVSEGLRQRALRRVFRSPEFNQVDGLEVYNEDYRSFEGLGEMVTQHMRQRLRREAEPLAGPVDPAGEPEAARSDADEASEDDDSGDPGSADPGDTSTG